jgi:AraC-like DNA-binding protein
LASAASVPAALGSVTRRSFDWVFSGAANGPKPALLKSPVPDDLSALVCAFDELLLLDDVDAMFKRATELALECIGLERVGLYLLDAPRSLMLGTWGTDLQGKLVDEHHVMYEPGEVDREVFRRAATRGIPFTVVENWPILVQLPAETKVVGRGWVAFTPIRTARTDIGMMFNDTALSGDAPDQAKQARAAILCSLLGTLFELAYKPAGGGRSSVRHPLVRRTARLLDQDPSLGGKELATALDISLSRLARVFKAQMGMSLVEYRNRVRLERFQGLLDGGDENLLAAALAAGFGSYAQFHRVFREIHGATPRAYLVARARAARVQSTAKDRGHAHSPREL